VDGDLLDGMLPNEPAGADRAADGELAPDPREPARA
jgi:hypothetical protein